MKKSFLLVLMLFISLLIHANPCFEEIEDMAFVTILARSSVPALALEGVSFISADDDDAFPEKVTYRNSDFSTYLDSLSERPRFSSIWQRAIYSAVQNSATMKKTKQRLYERNYRKGSTVVSGTVSLEPKTRLKKAELLLSSDFSSVNVDADVDLLLRKDGEKYVIKGKINVRGDDSRFISVTSRDISVNGVYYKIGLKYRLTKAAQ